MTPDELFPSPALYAQKLERDAVFVLRLSEADYRAASFLDERVQTPAMQGAWLPYAEVERAAAVASDGVPLHFIFHTGHVGSTLLSRLIDEAGAVLGLREPLPLRTLAEAADTLERPGGLTAEHFDALLATFLKLWSRGFATTRAVVLKATSSSGRLAPRLMAAGADAKAVYLNLKAEPYLATLLAGANSLNDLRGFERERTARLAALLGASPRAATTIGELAAMSWLAESLTQARALEAAGARLLPLDFEAMLRDPGATVVRVLEHFAIAAPPGFAAAVARSPVLTRYSKAPQQFAYSPAMRAQLLAQARAEFGGEIRRGLGYLNEIARVDDRVAAVL
jgi:hypothetical protein